MAINFPTSLDNFTNPLGTQTLDTPDHAGQHSDANDALEALEAKIGLGAGTPTANKLLVGSGNGTATWTTTWTGGTVNSVVMGTPTVTGGTFNSVTLGTPTVTSPVIQGIVDGWTAATDTWTYASADDPTYTFTIAGVDLTTKYYAGMKIKLTQTTAKYFIITKVAFSTDTTITIYGGTDYDLANAAITSPYYSTSKAPAGFPLDPTKWTVEVTDTTSRSQESAASSTWYNLGSVSITIPIGSWWTEYSVIILHDSSSQRQLRVTLSTANNSQSDADFTVVASITGVYESIPAHKRKCLSLTSKTAYYLNTSCFTAGTPTIFNSNDAQKLIIRAVCAYL